MTKKSIKFIEIKNIAAKIRVFQSFKGDEALVLHTCQLKLNFYEGFY